MCKRLLVHFVALATSVLAACGGSNTTTPMPSPVATASHGTMTKTSASSITVNGVTFSVDSATVRIDDRAASAAALKNGMLVQVLGSRQGSSGTASRVEVENEVRGAVTAVSAATTPQFFMIGEVKVVVDRDTVYDDLVPANFASIQPGVFVEVHGFRDNTGNVLASRVEGKGMRDPGDSEVDELRGAITATNSAAKTFNLGAVVVSYTASTVFTPVGRCSPTSLIVGLVVEVHGAFTAANAFAATRVDCEDLEDEGMRPGHGEEAEVEGIVADLDKVARSFKLGGQLVKYSTTTTFRNGTIDDLVNGAEVEVEGTMDGTTLVADEIEFED